MGGYQNKWQRSAEKTIANELLKTRCFDYRRRSLRVLPALFIAYDHPRLTAAAWLTQFKGLKIRIIDRRSIPVSNGHADGIHCRTLEVMQSFGFADRVLKSANHMFEVTGPWFDRLMKAVLLESR